MQPVTIIFSQQPCFKFAVFKIVSMLSKNQNPISCSQSLKYLDSTGSNIEIRIPYVPDYNDDQIEKIARFLAPLQNVTKIRVLPYHNYAGSKYEALNIPNTLPNRLPTDAEIKSAAETIKNIANFVVLY